jgi:hypothetical protein
MHELPAKHERLTPIAYLPGRNKTGRRSAYVCRCDCGNETTIEVNDFRKGRTKSCGCFKRERMRTMTLSHDGTRKPEYSVWHMMKIRCLNPNATCFAHYGGRGITVCDRWRDSFAAFYADMGPRPSQNHSLDRIDNSKGYEPDNCRWNTSFVQARNRRSTRLLSAFGKSQCISDWAVEYGLTVPCLFARLRKGIQLEDALTIRLNDYAAIRAAKHRIPLAPGTQGKIR